MRDERCCGNCLYYERLSENGKPFGMVCMNEDSENYGYVMDNQDRCSEWDSND